MPRKAPNVPRTRRRGVLAKLLAFSARRVTPGGEKGWWRWLVPVLVIAVVALVAVNVQAAGRRAADALDGSTYAQQLASSINEVKALEAAASLSRARRGALSRDARVAVVRLRSAARGLRAKLPEDQDAFLLAQRSSAVAGLVGRTTRRGSTPGATLKQLAPMAGAVSARLARQAVASDARARSQSLWSLSGGLLLVVLLLWIFWAKRDAAANAIRQRRAKALWSSSSDLLIVVDAEGAIVHATSPVERLLGYDTIDLVGRPFLDLVDAEDRERARTAFDDAGSEAEEAASANWRVRSADGALLDVEGTCVNLVDDPSVAGFIVTLRDVGERIDLEDQLRRQAFHDSLTGLPNRALFEDRVRHAVGRSLRGHKGLAVLFVDLDDFKTVNDSLGHAAGDELLRHVALRLDECTRDADTAARLGGDEFAVLVETLTAEDMAAEVANRVHQAFERPFDVSGDEIFVHASIGIAIGAEGTSAEELLRNADTAMYAAKAGGKGRSQVFHLTMHTAAQKRFQLSGDLRRAVRDGNFTVHYQPLVDLKTRAILGLEALVRWDHPTIGQIPPDEFIPLAEETGLIVPIGRFVLEQACRQRQEWAATHPAYDKLYISVNLSGRQFKPAGQVVADVKAATKKVGLDPRFLVLEVTESILMHDRAAIARDLQDLQALGVRIAIDDFGTGYSALSYLREFPIDSVKMDRSFVRDLACGTGDAALVRSVLELGDALDMQIVAEGIEDQSQLTSLSDLHCGVGQGFYFAPPLEAHAVDSLLSGDKVGVPIDDSA
jgi:diguanylate cyclase (GGDEF)-like protein/PAS domain S-box-containing protein